VCSASNRVRAGDYPVGTKDRFELVIAQCPPAVRQPARSRAISASTAPSIRPPLPRVTIRRIAEVVHVLELAPARVVVEGIEPPPQERLAIGHHGVEVCCRGVMRDARRAPRCTGESEGEDFPWIASPRHEMPTSTVCTYRT